MFYLVVHISGIPTPVLFAHRAFNKSHSGSSKYDWALALSPTHGRKQTF